MRQSSFSVWEIDGYSRNRHTSLYGSAGPLPPVLEATFHLESGEKQPARSPTALDLGLVLHSIVLVTRKMNESRRTRLPETVHMKVSSAS